MDTHELRELLQCHENISLEYKKSRKDLPKDFWETYSSFANTRGGYIILGVEEDEERNPVVKGVENPEKIKTDLVTIASNRNKVNIDVLKQEDIQILEVQGKQIISIYVPEAPIQLKPVFLNNTITQSFIRKHDTDIKVSEEELGALLRNKSESLDAELLEGYTIDDLDLEAVIKYQAMLHQRNPMQNFMSMNSAVFLENIGVFQHDYSAGRTLKLTLGGLLFFGKYNAIISRIPYYHVDFFDKRGINERWSDRVSSGDFSFPDMNLFNYYSIVFEKLLASIERPFQLDKRMIRKSNDELKIALRELFVNMIVHADYLSNTTALIVEIHQPYYIFTNPGIMKIPVDSFFRTSQSRPRNDILVRLFTRMGASEHAGSGSEKILNAVVTNRFKEPEITTSLEKTVFKLWIATVADITPELTDLDQKIYNVLVDAFEKEGFLDLSAKEIIERIPGETESRIKRRLQELTKKNIVQKFGGNRNRKYGIMPTSLDVIKRVDVVSRMLKNKL